MASLKDYLKLKRKPKGLSLMEILVAIAISIVTMTSSAVFSANLIQRAQLNFMEISALQLQGIVVEQLRLVESALKKDIKTKELTDTTAYLYKAGAPIQPWVDICAQNGTAKYYSLLNDDTAKVVKVNEILGTSRRFDVERAIEISNGSVSSAIYNVYEVPNNVKANYGGFSSAETEVLMSVRKTYLTSADIGPYISFSTVIGYKLYGDYYFTKPLETKMVWPLVCK